MDNQIYVEVMPFACQAIGQLEHRYTLIIQKPGEFEYHELEGYTHGDDASNEAYIFKKLKSIPTITVKKGPQTGKIHYAWIFEVRRGGVIQTQFHLPR